MSYADGVSCFRGEACLVLFALAASGKRHGDLLFFFLGGPMQRYGVNTALMTVRDEIGEDNVLTFS